MADCGLCTIGNDKYRVVVENDYAVAAMIFNPVNATHQNIVPRRHVTEINQFAPEEAKGVFDLQYEVQRRLMELFPDHPPVIGIQTGKLATQPHKHWQAFSSDAHLRQLYARAHEVAPTPIGGKGIIWIDLRTHPNVPGTENDNPDAQQNLERFLSSAAESLRGTGNLERDRRQLRDLTHKLLLYNGFF